MAFDITSDSSGGASSLNSFVTRPAPGVPSLAGATVSACRPESVKPGASAVSSLNLVPTHSPASEPLFSPEQLENLGANPNSLISRLAAKRAASCRAAMRCIRAKTLPMTLLMSSKPSVSMCALLMSKGDRS